MNLAQFSDRYQTALLDLIKAKINGSEPILAPRSEGGKVISLMDARARGTGIRPVGIQSQAVATPWRSCR